MTITLQTRSTSNLGRKQGIYCLFGYVVRDAAGKELFWSQGFRTREERDANVVERGYAGLL